MPSLEKPGFPVRLALVFVLLSIGIAVAGFLYYQEQKRTIQRHRNDELSAIADLKASQIVSWRNARLSDGAFIRENPLIFQALGRLLGDAPPAQLDRAVLVWMIEYRHRHSYSNVILLDAKGVVRLSTLAQTQPLESGNLILASLAMQSRAVILSDLHRNAGGAIDMDLCVPIALSEQAAPLGALLIEIDPRQSLYPLIESWPMPSRTAETLLVRREGNEVLFLNELRHRKGTALSLRLPVERTVLTLVKPGPGAVGEAGDYRSVPVVAAARAIAGSPWILIAKMDREEIYGPLRQSAVSTGLLGLFLFIAAATSTLLLWREQQAHFYRRQHASELVQQGLVERLDVLSRHANDIILLADPTGQILDANERAILSYGYERLEFLRLTMIGLPAPEALPEFERQWARLMEEGGLVFESRHQRKDSSTFPVEISARLIAFEGNMCCQSVIRDISERKIAEEQLRLLESATLQTGDGVLIVRVTGEDACCQDPVFVNPAFREITGYGLEDIRHGAVRNLYQSQANPHLFEARDHGFRERCPKQLEQVAVRKDGSKFWAEWRFSPLATKAGVFTHCVWICRDITERKRAEESVRFLSSIVESSDDAIIGKNMEGIVLSWNQGAARVYGYAAGEMVGGPIAILVPPERHDEFPGIMELLKLGQSIEHFETERVRKDGQRIFVSLTVSPIKDAAKRVIGASVIARDISERKRAGEQLAEAHRRTSAILESISDGFNTFDREWRYTYVNAAAAKMVGKTPEELLGKSLWELWPHAADSTFGEAFRRAVAENVQLHFEAFYPEPLNRWYQVSCYPSPEGLTLFFNDTTERKRTQKALQLSEERYRSLAMVTTQIVWTTNPQGDVVDDMPMWRTFTGQSLEGVKGLGWLAAVHPDDRERTADNWSRAVGNRSFYNTEYRLRRYDGEYRWMAVHGVPVLEEDGVVREWVGTCADITERKQAEELLRESQADLNRAQAVAHVGSWRSNLERNELLWSDEAYRLFGIPQGTHVTLDAFLGAVHPDDRDFVERSTSAAMRGEPYDIEHRIIVGNTVKWVHERGEPNPLGGFGTVQDISERKNSEQARRLQAELLEQTHEPILTWELGGGTQFWNHAAETFYGFKPEEALGRGSHDLLQTVHPLGMNQIDALVERDGVWKGELVHTTKDGREVVVESIMRLFRDSDGRQLVLESNHDITDRKQAEEEVLRLNAVLEQRVLDRTAQLQEANKELEAFAYSVSHDLRAPLRAVDGFSRILLEEYAPQLPEEAQHYLQVARKNAIQMGELIDGLLKFSRLSRQPLCKQPIAPAALVHQVWEDLRSEHEGRQVEFHVDNLAPCEGDALLVKQVFVNLLSNALKYTRAREVAVIEVGCGGTGPRTSYFVRDNGVGFDIRYRDKLFGVFQRLHRADEYEGTGVGLATVQRIVHRHGGQVWADAVLNQGATFYFTLSAAADPGERNGKS